MLVFIIRKHKWTIESIDLVGELFKFKGFSLDCHENKDIAKKLAMMDYCLGRRD